MACEADNPQKRFDNNKKYELMSGGMRLVVAVLVGEIATGKGTGVKRRRRHGAENFSKSKVLDDP